MGIDAKFNEWKNPYKVEKLSGLSDDQVYKFTYDLDNWYQPNNALLKNLQKEDPRHSERGETKF